MLGTYATGGSMVGCNVSGMVVCGLLLWGWVGEGVCIFIGGLGWGPPVISMKVIGGGGVLHGAVGGGGGG